MESKIAFCNFLRQHDHLCCLIRIHVLIIMVFSFRCGKIVFHWRWMTFSLFKLSDPFLVLRFTQFGKSNMASGINLGQVTLLHFIDECVCYNWLYDSRLILISLSWCKILFDVLTVLETVDWLSGSCDAPESDFFFFFFF